MKGEGKKRKLTDARVCARGDGITCGWFLLEFIHSKKTPRSEWQKAANLDSIAPRFSGFLRGFLRTDCEELGRAGHGRFSVWAKRKTKARSVRNGFAQWKRAANELFSLTLLLSVIDNFC